VECCERKLWEQNTVLLHRVVHEWTSLQIIFVHKQVICQARVKFWPDKKPVRSGHVKTQTVQTADRADHVDRADRADHADCADCKFF